MFKLCLLILCGVVIVVNAGTYEPNTPQISNVPSYPTSKGLSGMGSGLSKDRITYPDTTFSKGIKFDRFMEKIGGIADAINRYERIAQNKLRELEIQAREEAIKKGTPPSNTPKKIVLPPTVKGCSITITTPVPVHSYQVKEAAEKTSDTFPIPCTVMSDFLTAQKKIAPFPDNFKPEKDEATCTIQAYKQGLMRHKNIPCERLEELVNMYEPKPGQLDCTQSKESINSMGFTPCTQVPMDKKPETPFTVLALGEKPKMETLPFAGTDTVVFEGVMPRADGGGNLTVTGPATRDIGDAFDFDDESLEEKTYNAKQHDDTATIISISAEE